MTFNLIIKYESPFWAHTTLEWEGMKNSHQLYISIWFPIHLTFPLILRPKILKLNWKFSISLGWFYIKCGISPLTGCEHSCLIVKGEILGFMENELLRKHLPKMFSLIKTKSWGTQRRWDTIPVSSNGQPKLVMCGWVSCVFSLAFGAY